MNRNYGYYYKATLLIIMMVSSTQGAENYHPTEQGIEHPTSYKVWMEAVSLHNNFRATFRQVKTPTQSHVDIMIKNPPKHGMAVMLVNSMYSKKNISLALSKSNRLERIDFKQDIQSVNLKSKNETDKFKTVTTDMGYVKIHGDGIFYYHTRKHNTGSIWPKWADRNVTPFTHISPPPVDGATLVAVEGNALQLDFKTKENDIHRYHLDPEQGMMPVRIEYFDIFRDGSLSLFRFYTVEKYELTPNGTYFPLESTQHDIAPKGIDGPLKVGSRTKSTLTHYEENVDFPESEFRYTFPKGTRVQDHILDIDYTVKEDHFGRISNAPYLVAAR